MNNVSHPTLSALLIVAIASPAMVSCVQTDDSDFVDAPSGYPEHGALLQGREGAAQQAFAEEEEALPGETGAEPGQLHAAWRLEEAIGLPERATELVAHVLVDVLGLDPQAPLAVDRFGADRPCRACAWLG